MKWLVRGILVALFVASMLFLLRMNLPKGQTKLYSVVPVLAMAFAWMWAESILNRRRLNDVKARLNHLGFSDSRDGRLHYSPEPNHHFFHVAFELQADWRGVPLRVAEFEYDIGRGRNAKTCRFFQVEAPFARDWPDFRLEPAKGFMHRPISQLFSQRLAASDVDGFAKNASLASDSPLVVSRLLGDSLREWLVRRPSYEGWSLQDGSLACFWRRSCDARAAEQALGRLAVFLSKLTAN
ncbi:MAG: hypothetical protein KF691_02145 [Phycisphaeraceae bacterium]|nr:hypothetical protein [Phycisphaeraceae bacterium]